MRYPINYYFPINSEFLCLLLHLLELVKQNNKYFKAHLLFKFVAQGYIGKKWPVKLIFSLFLLKIKPKVN